MLTDKKILLIISGGIAAYKALELIRLIGKAGGTVTTILTRGGAQFITPLSAGALSGQPVYTDLFSLKDETEMGHIRLSREADLIVVAPASASLMARMAHGLADDLASTVLLATDKPVLIAPAMNPAMWENPATQANLPLLNKRGIELIGPGTGDTACGETGVGRMAEPEEIMGAILRHFHMRGRLSGMKALVTSGPTFEPLDPVRFIGNRSSGKQGHAIARSLHAMGADVTLVTGPVSLPDPAGIHTVHVETAMEMLNACQNALPADIAVCAAAVSDWSAVAVNRNKIKKQEGRVSPDISLKENPDILATLAASTNRRPKLLVGFAAETENLLAAAQAKLKRKNCDWLVANDVAATQVFGSENNHVYLLTSSGQQAEWTGSKRAIADHIAERIAHYFETVKQQDKDQNHAANS